MYFVSCDPTYVLVMCRTIADLEQQLRTKDARLAVQDAELMRLRAENAILRAARKTLLLEPPEGADGGEIAP